tara:strand:- start:782 stop:1282 length:501 start_codon:yes stop_codon:yes gene_type:complete
MKTYEYPHFQLIAESFGRTLADGGDTILLTPGHPRYTFKSGTLNYDDLPTDPWRPCWGHAVGGCVPEARLSMVELREDIAEGYLDSKHPQVLFKEFKRLFEQTWHAAYEHGWMPQHPLCVGTWVDGEDIVFDVTTLVEDLSVAKALGRMREEKAIYSIENSKEITL